MKKLKAGLRKLTPLQRGTILLSLLLFVVSLFQPAFYIDRADYDAWANSALLFLLGWGSALGGSLVASVIWLANPLYILAVFFSIKGQVKGLYFGILASITAFSFSRLDEILTDEGGGYSKITALKAGYKLWLASMVVLTIGTAISLLTKKKALPGNQARASEDNKVNYQEMTINERLYAAGFLEEFDKALEEKDIPKVVYILRSVQVAEYFIQDIVDQMG